jgi:nucleolar protein 56
MRVKEWYSWHFPELARIVSDNHVFVQLVALIGDRATSTSTLEEIEAIIGDGELAERVIDTSNNSMGQ